MRSSVKAFAVFLLSLVCFMMLSCNDNVYIDDPLNHSHSWRNLELVPQKNATCKEAGYKTYYDCKIDGCDKWFWDIKGENLIEDHSLVKIPKLLHKDILIHTPAKDATCTEKGNIEFWYCPYCNEKFKDQAGTIATTQTDIPALGHNTGSWVTSETDVHYKVCSVCLDHIDEGLHEFTEWTKISDSPVMYKRECTVCHRVEQDSHAQHTMEHHEYNEETCTEDGNIEYWYCVVCQKYYSDEKATVEITQEQTVIPHHILSDWQYGKDTHWKICPVDGKVLEADHEWGEYQEQVSGTVTHLVAECTICGAKKVAPLPEYLLYDIGIGEAKLKNIEATPCGDFYVNDSIVTEGQSIEIDGSTVVVEFRPYLNSNVNFTPHCYDIDGSITEISNGVKDEKGNYKVSFTLSNTRSHSVNIQVATEGGSLSMTCCVKKKTV